MDLVDKREIDIENAKLTEAESKKEARRMAQLAFAERQDEYA